MLTTLPLALTAEAITMPKEQLPCVELQSTACSTLNSTGILLEAESKTRRSFLLGHNQQCPCAPCLRWCMVNKHLLVTYCCISTAFEQRHLTGATCSTA